MKTYQINVTQDLRGWYNGTIEMKADSPEDAINKLKEMELTQIDEQANWTQANEYYGDPSSIVIDEDNIEEI